MDYETITKHVFNDIARYERMERRKMTKYKVGDIVRIKRGRTIDRRGKKKAGRDTRGVVVEVNEYSKFNYTEYYIDLFLSEGDNKSLYNRRFSDDDIAEYKGRLFDDDDICTEEVSFLFEYGGVQLT